MSGVHRRQPAEMSDEERLKLIVALRKQKLGWRKIGERVGMSGNGAMQAWRRATEPDSYYGRGAGDTATAAPDDEEW